MNKTEKNKIIVEFLEWTKTKDKEGNDTPFYNIPIRLKNPYGIKEYIPLEGFIFDLDWNWLMEVIEKIRKFHNGTEPLNDTQIEQLLQLIKKLNESLTLRNEVSIEAVYNACLAFIKWYNEQKSAGKATSAKDLKQKK